MTDLSRYHRQMLLGQIGAEGQQRLLAAHAAVIGCGALGSGVADMLARAGVGRLTLVDRDLIELTNLQRQVLYDEQDLADGLPKAEAARRRLLRVNSSIRIDAIVDDVNPSNVEAVASGADVIIDGLDNFETRYLLNDVSVKYGVPYIYGGAVATHGMTATFLPHASPACRPAREWDEHAGPCLRCVFDAAPPAGASLTCDTAGVLGPMVGVISQYEAAEAIKILCGRFDVVSRDLLSMDLWHGEHQRLDVRGAYQPGLCVCCGQGRFEHLAGAFRGAAASLCGRDAVQIVPRSAAETDLRALAARLEPHGRVECNRFLLRARLNDASGPIELTVFPNGRAIIKGTSRPEVARGIYAKYLGA
ncbi:MAG: ThiF family adenylyltransferase [Phycisphaerales bacterium]|nr:ThiF family adenylyltransferase [Phycisphaerales bacterium]